MRSSLKSVLCLSASLLFCSLLSAPPALSTLESPDPIAGASELPQRPALIRQIKSTKWIEAVHLAQEQQDPYFEFHQAAGWRYAVEFKNNAVYGITIDPMGQRYESELPDYMLAH